MLFLWHNIILVLFDTKSIFLEEHYLTSTWEDIGVYNFTNFSESERNSTTGFRTCLLRFHSQVLLPLHNEDTPKNVYVCMSLYNVCFINCLHFKLLISRRRFIWMRFCLRSSKQKTGVIWEERSTMMQLILREIKKR